MISLNLRPLKSGIDNLPGILRISADETDAMRLSSAAGLVGLLVPLCALPAGKAHAQVPPLPSGVVQQLDQAIGQRVEATAVLATQSAVSRIGLGWTLNDANGAIYKIPWKFDLHDARSLGDSGLNHQGRSRLSHPLVSFALPPARRRQLPVYGPLRRPA